MKRVLHALLPLILSCNVLVAQNDPKAAPEAVVIEGTARFTVLTPSLLRLEWNEHGVFEDHASLVFINRRLPVPEYTCSEENGWLVLRTEKLLLRYRKGSGKFDSTNLSLTLMVAGKPVVWRLGLTDPFNLKGTTRTLDGKNGGAGVTLEPGILSRSGWALVDDSDRLLFDESDWPWVLPRPARGQDWYFFGHGHDYKQALYDFTRTAGRIPIPPRFAFGYWWSRYWTYSDEELRQLVQDMKTYDVPIDVLIIDMDWHETWGLTSHNPKTDPFGEDIGWTGYTWNRSLFPKPEQFLSWIHSQGLRTALNLHPASGIAPMEERYGAFAGGYGFDTTGHSYIPFAIEEKKWATVYFDSLLGPLEKQGIDFWWLDWQAWLENKNIKGLGNTWWLNYTFFTSMERKNQKRPLLFHRWGGLGNHRYQVGFSGDTYITWESLAYQPFFTATASNVGYGYWSHDIGGHMGGEPSQEMFLRWLQWGIFSPIVRTHSTKSNILDRRIWKQGEYFELMRDALQFRYQMVPYMYTAARTAYETGISLCRPMYYDYPEHAEAYEHTGQYMFGPDLLVAPVTEKTMRDGLAAKTIWLPEGAWFDWWSGTIIEGGRTVERLYSIQEIPVFVKAGSIIPMNPPCRSLRQRIDTLVLSIMPGPSGTARLYEDDGSTSSYLAGASSVTRIEKKTAADGSIHITIRPREGTFADAATQRAYEIRLPRTFPPSSVTVNGTAYVQAAESQPGRWWYNAGLLETRLLTPMLPCDGTMQVVIGFSPEARAQERLLDGKRQLFGRLPRIVQMMKDEVNRRDNIANAPEWVLKAGTLARSIQYEPSRALDLLREFDSNYLVLLRQIQEYPRGDTTVLRSILRQFPVLPFLLEAPSIRIRERVSTGSGVLELTAPGEETMIHYTIDGSMPTESSPLYKQPIMLDRTCIVKARSFMPGDLPSFAAVDTFQHVWASSVRYEFPCSPRYAAGGEFALANGTISSSNDHRSDFVGFQGTDFIAVFELPAPQHLSSVTIRFLQNQWNWIFLPTRVIIEGSTDGRIFRPLADIDNARNAAAQSDAVAIWPCKAVFKSASVRTLRVRAWSSGPLPSWHRAAGNSSWIFTDEVTVGR